MFTTLRSKIIFFVTLILFVTATTVMFFTDRDISNIMLKAGKESAHNVLNLVEVNIRDEYYKLRVGKIATIRERRDQLRNIAHLAVSVVKQYEGLLQNQTLTKKDLHIQFIDWLNSVAFPHQIEAFVFNDSGEILAHSNKVLIGSSIAQLVDIKSRNILQVMGAERIKADGDFAVFHWDLSEKRKAGKKIAFFLPLPGTPWILATEVSIGDIEAEADAKLNKTIESLKVIFGDINIADTGCAMVFDGHRTLLIPPCQHDREQDEQSRPDGFDNRLLDTIMEAANSEHGSARLIAVPGQPESELQIYASYFKPLDWYLAVYLPMVEIQQPAKSLIARQVVIITLIFLLSLIISFVWASRISRPLNTLAAHAMEIPNQDFTQELPENTFLKQFPGKSRGEVDRLAHAFVFMQTELRKNIHKLMETTASRERIVSELNVAQTIQMGILPMTFPPFPNHTSFDLYAYLKPAKSVGGDLYDYFFIDDDHLCFTVGDVSDKGVPAALFMMITRTLIKTLSSREVMPAEVMTRINDILSQDNPRSMFVTLIIGMLNIKTGHLRYSNGGHNLPILLQPNQTASYQSGISGPLVGAMEKMTYTDLELILKPGDALFLYTDGVTEAMDEQNRLFSDERLLEEVSRLSEQPVSSIIGGVQQAVEDHTARAEVQSDDITMLVIRYNNPE